MRRARLPFGRVGQASLARAMPRGKSPAAHASMTVESASTGVSRCSGLSFVISAMAEKPSSLPSAPHHARPPPRLPAQTTAGANPAQECASCPPAMRHGCALVVTTRRSRIAPIRTWMGVMMPKMPVSDERVGDEGDPQGPFLTPRPNASVIVRGVALLLFVASVTITVFQYAAWDTVYEQAMREHPWANISMLSTEADKIVHDRLCRMFIRWPLGVTFVSMFASVVLLAARRWRWWWILLNLGTCVCFVLAFAWVVLLFREFVD